MFNHFSWKLLSTIINHFGEKLIANTNDCICNVNSLIINQNNVKPFMFIKFQNHQTPIKKYLTVQTKNCKILNNSKEKQNSFACQ